MKSYQKWIQEVGLFGSIASSLDGSVLYVACDDGTGRCVDLATRRVVTLSGHDGNVYCIIPGDDGVVFTCGDDKTVRMWESQSGKNIKTFTGHGDRVYSLLYSGKEKQLFSGSSGQIHNHMEYPHWHSGGCDEGA